MAGSGVADGAGLTTLGSGVGGGVVSGADVSDGGVTI